MTRQGTIEKIKAFGKWSMKFTETIDSIMGKAKWFGIAATIGVTISHYSACKDRDNYKKQYEKIKPADKPFPFIAHPHRMQF